MRPFVSYGPALVVLLTAGTALVVVPAAISRVSSAMTAQRVVLARAELDADNVLERVNAAVRNVADSVEPSVVHIDIGSRFTRSSGSGWIFDDAGHIVTNAHVVSSQDTVSVQLHDGRMVRGKVIGSDPLTDIAVIKVDQDAALVPARRATGERVRQGERVFAFGSPFGYKFSMSEGIVSGVGRTARAGAGQSTVGNFIQTDAAVNPGNSGGPLVDVRGRVVGMNVAIATAANSDGDVEGQSAGISFAIPLEAIENRVASLVSGVTPTAGFIGVSMSNRSRRENGWGVEIERVTDGSPAALAGLLRGDLVTKFNSEVVVDDAVLRAMIASCSPGTKVKLTVQRDAKEIELELTIGSMPDEVRAERYVGMLAEQAGIQLGQSATGPSVAFVIPESSADRAGFTAGQRITKVAGEPVATPIDVMLALEKAGAFSGRIARITVQAQTTQSEGGENLPEEKVLDLRLWR